jgi:hypothetical protein
MNHAGHAQRILIFSDYAQNLDVSMDEKAHTDTVTRETLAQIEQHVRCRLAGLLRDFQLVFHDNGLVLRGHVHTFYAKQLTQHAVMEASSLLIRANEMEVS